MDIISFRKNNMGIVNFVNNHPWLTAFAAYYLFSLCYTCVEMTKS